MPFNFIARSIALRFIIAFSFGGVFVGSLAPVYAASSADVSGKIRFDVEKFHLDNGLTVLVHEDHAMPIVSYQQWFRVGSSHEKPGRTGLAHFFEHLMFKGTTKYPKGEIDRIIQMNGGSYNAFTTEDYTGYYTNLPSDKLELIVDVESDRMRNLLFEESEINSEREVVKEERRMRYENSVYGSLFELVRQTLFKTSQYRWPVIGSMADLNAASLGEFKEFYTKYYAPNNAVVVVAGDVTVSAVKKLMRKYYEPIARQDVPKLEFTPEVEQKSARYAQLVRDVQSVTMAIVYPGAKAGDTDAYALDLLASALGAGTSSRLYRRLVYNAGLATQVSVGNNGKLHAGDFSIFVSLSPGASSDRVIALVNAELAGIKRQKVGAEELEKLKNQVKLGYVKGLQTMSSRAQALALNEMYFSDYKRLFDDLALYEAVTADDIHRVANQYITPAKRSLVQIKPRSRAEASP